VRRRGGELVEECEVNGKRRNDLLSKKNRGTPCEDE